jgi:hypothetical protein
MVLARPGYVPAHTIDYYVSTIQATYFFSIPPPKLLDACALRLKNVTRQPEKKRKF